MDNQKISKLIKKITFCFLLFGITTMNYAEKFKIKHKYTDIVKTLSPPMSTSSNTIVISNDDNIIIDHLTDVFSVKSDEFGIFKVPLTEAMKVKTKEVNQLLRMPYVEKLLATKNKEKSFSYVLDINTQREKFGTIEGLEITRDWNLEHFLKYGSTKQAKNSQKISQFYIDLIENYYSKDRFKFADFYGTTNIIPRKEGLEVILTLKNVGPFDVTFSNPSHWGDIANLEEPFNENKIWYEVRLGAQCHEKSCWTRLALQSEYLIKNDFSPEELAKYYFILKSNSERNFRYLIPYNKITTTFTNGEINSNRTKEGYIHFDQGLALKLTFWNMDVDFGGVFSKRVWKEEKESQIKGWINLE